MRFFLKFELFIEDELAILVLLNFWGEWFSGLFDDHFAWEFDFHFDGDDCQYEVEYFILSLLGHEGSVVYRLIFIPLAINCSDQILPQSTVSEPHIC